MITAEFIVDCGPTVGLGHLRRCLVLAHALARTSIDCGFAITDESCYQLVKDEGFRVRVVERGNPEVSCATILIVDGYYFGLEFSKAIKKLCTCRIFLDDMGDRPVESEFVLNPNIYGPEIDYTSYPVSEALCGIEYNLVSEAFFKVAQDRETKERSDCLVSFGATDDGRYAGPVVSALLEKTGLRQKVVLSPLLPISGELKDLAAASSGRVEIYHGGKLNELMATSQLYVGAAGAGALEALASGLRIVVSSIVENQKFNAQAFRALGENSFDDFDPALIAETAAVLETAPAGEQLSIIEASGGSRIAEQILNWIKVHV